MKIEVILCVYVTVYIIHIGLWIYYSSKASRSADRYEQWRKDEGLVLAKDTAKIIMDEIVKAYKLEKK